MTPDQIDRLCATWTVLARLFDKAPDPGSLANMRSAEMLASWPMSPGPRTDEGVGLLLQSAEEVESADQIKDDHFFLVLGPGKTLAPPWESVYRSEEKLLFVEETMHVRQFYRRFGLQAPKLNREPDDHISLELEFCARLLTQALDALEVLDPEKAEGFLQAHRDFCEKHLFEWADQFFAKVEQGARTCFYRGVGVLGADALIQAREWVVA